MTLIEDFNKSNCCIGEKITYKKTTAYKGPCVKSYYDRFVDEKGKYRSGLIACAVFFVFFSVILIFKYRDWISRDDGKANIGTVAFLIIVFGIGLIWCSVVYGATIDKSWFQNKKKSFSDCKQCSLLRAHKPANSTESNVLQLPANKIITDITVQQSSQLLTEAQANLRMFLRFLDANNAEQTLNITELWSPSTMFVTSDKYSITIESTAPVAYQVSDIPSDFSEILAKKGVMARLCANNIVSFDMANNKYVIQGCCGDDTCCDTMTL